MSDFKRLWLVCIYRFLFVFCATGVVAQKPSATGVPKIISLSKETDEAEKAVFWAGRFYVKIKPSAHTGPLSINGLGSTKNYPQLAQLLLKYGVVSIKTPFIALKTADWAAVYDIQLSKTTDDGAFLKAVSALDYIEYAEAVPIMRQQYTPNDPQQANQYSLSKIQAFSAWDTHRGGNCVIAIVDDAVRMTHEDLANNIWINPNEIPNNGIDDDHNGYIDDINGYDVASNDNDPSPSAAASNISFTHGTHCAGIAGAVSDNGKGIASIGFNNKIMCVKTALQGNGSLPFAYEGVAYAIAANAKVISMSWGGGGFSQTAQNLYNTAFANGIVCVAAAGNDNTNVVAYPAAYDHVISVAATDQNDTRTVFSNYGSWVDVAAPGLNILSTLAGSDNAYGTLSGTSMACPLVAGLAGLIRSRNPNFTPTQVENCIKAFADNINAQNPNYQNQLGTGRINANGAIQCSGTCSSPITTTPITVTNFPSTTIEAGNTVQFAASATNATLFAWTINGELTPFSTNATAASRAFNTQGNYRIFYAATNANPLCRQQTYLDVNITCSINIQFTAPTSVVVNTPLSILNTSSNPNTVLYQWFLNGVAVTTPPTIFSTTGQYELELRATNGICTVSKKQAINVFEQNSETFFLKRGQQFMSENILTFKDGSFLQLSAYHAARFSKHGDLMWDKIPLGALPNQPYLNTAGTETPSGNVLIVQSEDKSKTSPNLYDKIVTFELDTATGNVIAGSTHRYAGTGQFYPKKVFRKGANYVIIGNSLGDILDPTYTIAGNQHDVFMLCVDANGNKLWERHWGKPDANEYVRNVIMTDDGGFLLTGQKVGTRAGNLYFALKTDGNGNPSWYRFMTSDYVGSGKSGAWQSGFYGVTETCDAYYFLATNPSLLVKMTKKGAISFVKKYDVLGNQFVTDMVADNEGNLTMLSFYPAANENGHAYLTHLNPQGDVTWARQFRGLGVYIPLSDNPYALGRLKLTGDDGFLLNFTGGYNGNSLEGIYTIKTDRNGLVDCLASAALSVSVKEETDIWYLLDSAVVASSLGNLVAVSGNARTSATVTPRADALICPTAIACNGLNVSLYSAKKTYCQGERVDIANASSGYTSVSWLVDGQNTSPINYNFGIGSHTIQLTATNGMCSATISREIKVVGSANAGFSYTVQPITPSKVYGIVAFTPSVSDACGEPFWDFGDGQTSFDLAPFHHYLQAGTYNVCQKVMNVCGQTTSCQSVVVACPLEQPLMSDASGCFGTPLSLNINNPSAFGTVRWYNTSSGGTALASGNTYTLPQNMPIGSHTFYAKREENFETALGYTYNQVSNTPTNETRFANWKLNTPLSIKLRSFDVFLKQADSLSFQVTVSTPPYTVVYQSPKFFVPAATLTTLNLNAVLPKGDYLLYFETNNIATRVPFHQVSNNVFSVNTYAGNLTIQPNVGGPTPTQYYWGLYNAQFGFFDSCATARTPVVVKVNPSGTSLSAKVFLEGPFNATTNLMNDNLRTQNLLPTTSPYGTGETVDPSVLSISGNNAIVDWVKMELRSPTNLTQTAYTRSALLQRDGDVVDVDGKSPVSFNNAPLGSYHFILRHRNHLGIMTSTPYNITAGSCINHTVDCTTTTDIFNGGSALKVKNNLFMLWAGDNNQNGSISYNGSANDKVAILQAVGFATPNNSIAGYSPNDLNLDGVVKYNGANNDKLVILTNVGFATPNVTIVEQIPR